MKTVKEPPQNELIAVERYPGLEKTVKTMLKIRERGDSYALAVKLADRIANTAFSRANQSPQYSMYQKEYPFIRWFLKQDTLIKFWNELDELTL